MITVVIASTMENERLVRSVESLRGQNTGILVFRVKGAENIGRDVLESCEILEKEYENIYEGYSDSIEHITTEYVQFWLAGDTVTENAYENLWAELADKPERMSEVIAIRNIFFSSENRAYAPADSSIIDFNETPQNVPVTFHNMIFRMSSIGSTRFDKSMTYDAELLFMWEIIAKKGCVYKYDKAALISISENVSSFASFAPAQDEKWYMDTLEGYIRYIDNIRKQYGEIPKFIQYGVLFELKMRYEHNLNTRDKHVCTNRLDELRRVSRQILGSIDDRIILNVRKYNRYKMSNSLKMWLMNIKYDSNIKLEYYIEAASGQVYLSYNGILFEKFAEQRIVLDTLNLEKDCFVLEFSFMDLTPKSDYILKAVYNNNEIEITDTDRYAQIRYFGIPVQYKRTFMVKIPLDMVDATGAMLEFYSEIEGIRNKHKYETSRFPSRILHNVNGSYWYRKHYMVRFAGPTRIEFIRASFKTALKQEFKYMKNLFGRSKRMFLFRIIYWMTYRHYRKKHIWITFDKMYKAGDNGEYFYRYAIKQDDDITVKYIVNKGYPDTKRLKNEGLKPLIYGTLKQSLYFLHASVIAATHANIPIFSGILPQKFQYVQDLLRGEVVCIQHGLAVQQLEHNLNSQYDNTRKFYCASPYEIKNLEQKEYGYYDKSDLELVGVCRYDGLVNRDIRQILITPTWRSYISMPVSIGNTRPYSEDFKNTTYFKVFNSLINNQKLADTADRCGYKLVYLLHPTISSQIGDFQPLAGVEVKSPVGVNYEKILTESSLMVTDYSGVQFDFAYMRKPVVYYHTPLLPPHYEEGGFFHDTMGFGEICIDEEQLVNTLCEYMENNCVMKEFYVERANNFFAYSDHSNCERVYNAIKHFDSERLKIYGK